MDENKNTDRHESVGVHCQVIPLYDLIYCDIAEAKELLEIYPQAKTSDASDFIHEERFDISITDTRKNYLKNIICTGLSDVSLMCQTVLGDKEEQYLIREILDELKAV
jgi:hypothetical protein